MFNKQVLSRITSALNSAKAPAKKKDIIVDPRGQWDHPGQPTRIPANEITMRGVPYPVMAYPDNGQPQLMYPDQEYSFPGAKYVDEYPQMNRMRNGGTLPQAQKGITISDYNDYAYRKAAYDDSLYLYNQNNSKLPSISVFQYSPSLTHPNGINRPAIKVKQNPRKIIKSKDDQMRGLYFAKYFPTETPIYKNYYNKTGKKLPTNLPVWLDSQTAYQYPHFKYTNKYPNGYGYIKPGEKLKEQIEYAGRWKKPVQPVYFGKTDPILNSNNTNPFLTRPEAEIKTKEEPVEEIGRLPLKPLTEIPTKYNTKGYVPNASYLNTKKNTIKPPASTTQWVQHPKTGTWYQIERPLHPALLPTYDLRTGSYKQKEGGVLPKAQIGKDVQSTAISAQDYMDAYNHAIALENYMKNRLDYHSIDSKKDGYYGGDIPSSEMIYNDLNSNFNRWTDPKRQYPRNIIRNNIMSEDVLQKDIPILDYYQQIDENKFRQRELLDGTIDMDFPMGYYDKRIPISQIKEYRSNDPDMHNGVTIPMYDQHYLKDEMIKSDPNIQYDESGKAFIPQKKQVTAAPNKGLILPESTLKWVQNPQTGTWHQIQRPQDTNLTPVYDINTGSNKKQREGGVLPQAQKGIIKNWQEPNVIDTDENTGYNAATGEINQDSRPGSIENNNWWLEHEKFHHLQNLAGGMSTSGIMGQRPNNTVASDQAMGNYYDRRNTELETETDAMIKADPNLQFIPRNKLQESTDGFIGANDLMYSNPSTVEGEARNYENYIRQGGKSIFPQKKQGGALLTKKVTCKKCGWEWDAADGGNDITTCHKCGGQGLVHAQNGGQYTYGDRDYKKDSKGNWSVAVKGVWTPLSQNVEARTKELNKNAKFVRELQGYNPNQSSRYDMMASNKPQVADNTKVVKEIPDNRTFAEINEDNKFKATKKKIESDFDKATKYYEDYHGSPMYKSMLNNSMRPGEDASFFSDNRTFNLLGLSTPTVLRTQPIGEENIGGWSDSYSGHITVTPFGYKVQGLFPHEISHSIDRPIGRGSNRLIPGKDIAAITKFKPKNFMTSPGFKTLSVDDRDALINNIEGNKDYLKTQQKWIDYVSKPTETRARLNDIRMQSKLQHLYDPFTQKVSPDIYRKLLKTKFEKSENKEFDALQQLKDVYTDEQIQWMLNNISQNQEEDQEDIEQGVAKQGGTNKVVNAYSKHFQPGGFQETRLPKRIVNRYPGMQNVYGSEGENLNVIKDPNYAASDYGFGDIEFIHPGSGHVQYSDDYDYQSPTPDKYTAVYNPKGANKHDVFLDTMHGMRDDPEYMKLLDKFSAETKKARGTSMDHWYGVDSEKDPYLVGDGREQWDKNFIDGVLRSHLAKKGMGRHSSDVKGYKMEREESTPEMYKATDDIYKYLKGKFKKGGFQDDLGKNRKVFEDWTYGKDLGMTYLPKAQNGIIISDPKEYAYRNKMYTDSLNLYNAYKMQDKLMGPYSGTSKNKYKWNTAELKKGRKKEMVPGIPYPIADDYQNEKDQFKDGFDPWTARPEDLKLIKYYKSLGFTDKDIMYHSSPDVVSDKIRAVGTYDDGTAASPIYRKPKQKVTFGPNNVLPVEEKLELKTKPLQFIDTNRDIQDIVPNADYLKQYLQTRSANAIVPPASTVKWVQHPQTGTWYQIERPQDPRLTPEYNIRTGTYKKQ